VIRVLIVDDEPLARDTLRIVIATDPEVTIVGSCSGAEAPPIVAASKPDIMFLDIEMPKLGGFELVEAIGPGAVPVVVFVTAHAHYAVKAFEVHALDYLLKPFDDRRLLDSLSRAKHSLRDRGRPIEDRILAMLEEREATTPVQRFVVRGRDNTVFVAAGDVDWFEAADDYVELHVGATSHIVRERLADLEKRLDPKRFVRIHRSTIVNLDRVRSSRPMFRGDAIVVLADGTELRLSRSRRDEFRRRLTGSTHSTDSSSQVR
jgi:two-component system LytT family response regulator